MLLSNVTYKYKGATSLLFENMDYHVDDTNINFLIGKNGAGKTTLVDIFLGLRNCQDCSRNYTLGKDFTYINQLLPMVDKIKCSEIAQLVLGIIYKNSSIGLPFLRDKVDPFSYDFLNKHWSAYYFELSGGERKLLQMILFLNTEKSLYVLDEPTAFIDRQNARFLFDIIKEKKDKTFIIITHDYRDISLCEDYTVSLLDDHGCIHYTEEEFERVSSQQEAKIEFLDYFVAN